MNVYDPKKNCLEGFISFIVDLVVSLCENAEMHRISNRKPSLTVAILSAFLTNYEAK